MTEPAAPDRIAEDPLVGRTIDDRYTVEGVLGEGGMGLVYRGRHAVLGRPVAVKVLRREVSKDEVLVARFMREAQSASAIGNEHIVDILDFGRLPDGSTYFVMEYLDGRDLRDAIQDEAPMPVPTALHIAKQLCRALAAAHAQGIVHRDIKPENIFLVARPGALPFVKVLDFGVAKAGSSAMMRLTKTGHLLGTPLYMSPEQCAGAVVDQRTDIYAIGVVLYEMLSGMPPLNDESVVRLLYKQLHEQPIPLSALDPPVPVPPELEALVMRCLAKRASERYQTAEEVLARLEEVDPHASAVSAAPVSFAAPSPQERSSVERLAPGADTMDELAPVLARASMAIPGGHDALNETLPRTRLFPMLAGLGVLGAVAAAAMVVWALLPSSPGATVPPGEQRRVGIAGPPTATAARTDPSSPPRPVPRPESMEEPPRIELTTAPAGAEVWLDGSLVGNTPVSVPRPADGETFELTIRAPNRREETVRLTPGSPDSLSIPLERERPRPGAPSATGMEGDTMAPAMVEAPQEPPPPPSMRPVIDPGAELIDPFG